MRISVVGCGYLGAVHAAAMAELGHEVVGIDVAAQLPLQGADVRVTDPAAIENSRRLWPQLDYAATPEEAAERADAVLVLTEWRQYRELDPVAFGEVVAQKRVLDGRNALDREAWTAAGWTYRALGRRAG